MLYILRLHTQRQFDTYTLRHLNAWTRNQSLSLAFPQAQAINKFNFN